MGYCKDCVYSMPMDPHGEKPKSGHVWCEWAKKYVSGYASCAKFKEAE